MRKIAVGRCVGLGVALASLALATYCAFESAERYAAFDEWMVARPMTATIDLSRPGEFTVPFVQTCSIAHGESVRLQTDPQPADETEAKRLVQGLAGEITIRDAPGNEVETASFNGATIFCIPDQSGCSLTSFYPFAKGEYMATIRIQSGAPNLAEVKHSVFAQYDLCGLEQFPAVICSAFAVGAGIATIIAGVLVAPGLISHGLSRHDAGSA